MYVSPHNCRGARAGCLVSCDFCPLVFHLDCVHPPLSTHPSSVWMCPVHAEHMMVSQSGISGEVLLSFCLMAKDQTVCGWEPDDA